MLGVFLDQETTGLDSDKHNVIELAFIVIDLATGEQKASYSSVLAITQEMWNSRDPSSILVNGYTFEEVKNGKSILQVCDEVIQLLQSVQFRRGKGVFICQNPSFDRAFFAKIVDTYTQEKLVWPYHWLDLASMFWALEVKKAVAQKHFAIDETHLSKDAIAHSLGLKPEAKPHRAMQGVQHLFDCYTHMIGFPI